MPQRVLLFAKNPKKKVGFVRIAELPILGKFEYRLNPSHTKKTQLFDHQESPVNEQQKIRKPTEPIPRAENQQPHAPKPPIAEEQEISFLQKMGSAAPSPNRHPAGRHASPLWFPSSPSQDQVSTSSRPRKKVMLIMGIVMMLLIFLSIIVWFFLEPNGTNPFDSLSIPTWSMNNKPLAVPQESP